MHNLPQADILIHSGDFTLGGSDTEALDFLEWLRTLPYSEMIFIAGNHDDCMRDATLENLPNNIHYLKDNSVNIAGINFYGAPMWFGEVGNHVGIIEHYDLIPKSTDVLITHRPPFGILDGSSPIHYGSSELLDKVIQIQPRLHLFGHAHDCYGTIHLQGITFSNAAVVDNYYKLLQTGHVLELDSNS